MSKPTQSGFSPRLRDIKESFPMPGNYHFRFKTSLIPGTDREKGAFAVWMDCSDDDQHVGVWRNTIFAKVTRINMDDAEAFYHATPTPAATRTTAAPTAPRTTQQIPSRAAAPAPRQAPAPVAESGNLLGGFDEQPTPQQPTYPTRAPSNEGNLLDVPTAPQPHREASLLDMHGPTYSAASSENNSTHDDFLGMTSAPVQTPTPPVSAPVPAPMPVQMQAPSSYGNPLAGQAQVRPANGNSNNVFSSNNGPFGGLNWK
jgi:hypothetical protein